MPYVQSADLDATRGFYTRVPGLEEGEYGGGWIGFGSGQAQVLFVSPDVAPVVPDMGVDVGSRAAVDAAHAEAVRQRPDGSLQAGVVEGDQPTALLAEQVVMVLATGL